MTLLVKSFRTIIPDIKHTFVKFLFTVLFCCHLIANVMILLIVSLLLVSLSNIY